LWNPSSVRVDAAGNVFFVDNQNLRVRKINTAGIISTVAGTGSGGYSGDGGPATDATLSSTSGIWLDATGNMFIADAYNYVIRKVTPSGIISTVAGNNSAGFSTDGTPATAAMLGMPLGISGDIFGNLYISEYDNLRIRKVSAAGILSTIAGTGTAGYTGDGGASDAATIDGPNGIAFNSYGLMYFADANRHVIRSIKLPATGVASVVSKASKIFPNPAHDILTIDCSSLIGDIVIRNVAGETVYTNTCKKEQLQINVAQRPVGTYFLTINNTDIQKFVKE